MVVVAALVVVAAVVVVVGVVDLAVSHTPHLGSLGSLLWFSKVHTSHAHLKTISNECAHVVNQRSSKLTSA